MYKDLRSSSSAYYEAESAALDRQAEKYKKDGADQILIAAWVADQKINLGIQQAKAGDDLLLGMKAGWDDFWRTQATQGKEGFELMQKSIKSLSSALTEFVKTGKLDLKSLADSIITEIIRIQIQQAISGAFGTGKKGDNGWIGSALSFVGSLFHEGGVVGSDYAPARAVPAMAYANAPRFHGGFQPDEYPAILQKGEGVFTKKQMQALGKDKESEPATTNNTFVINAVDAKSFDDMCRRNPSSIVTQIMGSLRDNKTRSDMKGLLK
jgi:lambda family phage tail tape measure protein